MGRVAIQVKVTPSLCEPMSVSVFAKVSRDFMQRRFAERRFNANVEWCFVIGQCHGNSALFDVGVDAASSETSLHKVTIKCKCGASLLVTLTTENTPVKGRARAFRVFTLAGRCQNFWRARQNFDARASKST